MKRKLLLLIGCTMMFSMAGCNFMQPKTATDVAKRAIKAMEKVENFSMKGEIGLDLDITAKGENADGVSLSIPMDIEMEVDSDTKGNSHSVINMEMSFREQKNSEEVEAYTVADGDEQTLYTKSGNDWVRSTPDDDESLVGDVVKLDEDAFSKGELTVEDEAYIVKINIKDLSEENFVEDFLKGDLNGIGDLNMEDFMKDLEDAELVYTFNKKTFLVEEISIEGFEVSSETEIEGTPAEVSMSLKTNFEFSEYDKLDKDDYMVSESIKKDAIDEDDVDESDVVDEDDIVDEGDIEIEKPDEEPADKPDVDDEDDGEDVSSVDDSDDEVKSETDEDNRSNAGSGDTYTINGPDGYLCTVYCPSYLIVEDVYDYGIDVTYDDDEVYFNISSIVPLWAEDFLNTGSFETDEEYYSYQNIEMYDSVETAQGTVTILKYDSQLSGFDTIDTAYCAILEMGEYSPNFEIDSSDLEDLGVSLEQIISDIFG